MANILVGVTGGIAAYKSAVLVRLFVKHGHNVRVMMTDAACQFVMPLTFQALTGQAVYRELLNEHAELGMGHIELARWADMVVIAPASANSLAKLSCGLADNLLTTVCLAATAPIVIAPAMNEKMWANAITCDNIQKLRQFGYHLISPACGEQACGDMGFGRMAEPDDIAQFVNAQLTTTSHAQTDITQSLSTQRPNTSLPTNPDYATQRPSHSQHKPLHNKKVVITAGATIEAIDPVRYLSNHSTGKMGYAIAQACVDCGADVVIVSGKNVHLPTPIGATRLDVTCADDMLQLCLTQCQTADIFIATAAVADFKMATIHPQKLKKHDNTDGLVLTLTKNADILATISATYEHLFTVGFAAETQDVEQYAQDKLIKKNLDMIAVNDVSDKTIGFGSDDNAMTVFFAKQYNKNKQSLPKQSKAAIAAKLIEMVIDVYQNRPSDLLPCCHLANNKKSFGN